MGGSELLYIKLPFYTVTSLEAVVNILREICQYKGTENRLFINISCPLSYHSYYIMLYCLCKCPGIQYVWRAKFMVLQSFE